MFRSSKSEEPEIDSSDSRNDLPKLPRLGNYVMAKSKNLEQTKSIDKK